MTWHKIVSVQRSFFGKYYEIKCASGELFKRVPTKIIYGTPVAGAFVRKYGGLLGIRYEIWQPQR
jgi:hypothetical protein